VERARREHPRLRISGWHHGYLSEDDTQAVVAEAQAVEPDILFVGMPTPLKEFWLSENLEGLGIPFCMGVGGSFDVYAGTVRRAPEWMQRYGLEWLFRLMQEPGRMWKRYLVGNAAFVLLVGRYWVGCEHRRLWARRDRAAGRRSH
jgi:N-acetylglucosaminyldiphosphoundecaprenol N-acetyl-beta-D-mannosaminyltransferase